MADNYLERHYEEYEAKKAAWEKAKKLGKIRPKQTARPASVNNNKVGQSAAQTNK